VTSDHEEPIWHHDTAAFEAAEERHAELLGLIGRFAATLGRRPWFSRLGDPLSRQDRHAAESYLEGLGFPDAEIALISDFDEAIAAAESLDLDAAGWEAEESLRAALTADAMELLDAEALDIALTHVAAAIAEPATQAAEAALAQFGVDDEQVFHLVAGTAVQAAHNAALVLAAGAEEDHPFAVKFRLFENGRWPIGLAGSSFNLF